MLKPYLRDLQTIIFDNGKEFAHHERNSKQLGVNNYFASHYSSSERGLNESHNGLFRQCPQKNTLWWCLWC